MHLTQKNDILITEAIVVERTLKLRHVTSLCSALCQRCNLVQITWFPGTLRSLFITLPCRTINRELRRIEEH